MIVKHLILWWKVMAVVGAAVAVVGVGMSKIRRS